MCCGNYIVLLLFVPPMSLCFGQKQNMETAIPRMRKIIFRFFCSGIGEKLSSNFRHLNKTQWLLQGSLHSPILLKNWISKNYLLRWLLYVCSDFCFVFQATCKILITKIKIFQRLRCNWNQFLLVSIFEILPPFSVKITFSTLSKVTFH